MSSERRLHPYSILFAFLTQIRLFVVPGILVAVGASSRGNDWADWQPWMMLFIIPTGGFALVRYLTYVYRYEERELVIRSGLLFKRERHIPYARIQNVDAVQNLLHRALNVVEVKIETGGGESAEATMSVLPVAALQEMRERVLAERAAISADRAAPFAPEQAGQPEGVPLIALGVRDLLLCGFIENRGGVLIAAAFGLVWEFGLFERLATPVFGQPDVGSGFIRSVVRRFMASPTIPWDGVAWAAAGLVALLLFMRVVSMVWAVIRLYGFTVVLAGGDARAQFGLFTRVTMTVPLRRIQVVTIRESPLHRRFKRVSVRVDTAGGRDTEEGETKQREPLAPILKREELPSLVRTLSGIDLGHVDWMATHPRAFRREIKGWLFAAAMISAPLVYLARWYAAPLVLLLVLWAVVGARQTVRHLRWARTDDALLFASGWLWRRTTVVRLAKMQVVTWHESPFDRRTHMASVHVDTAGASAGSAVHIPYLDRPVATALYAQLAAAAASTELRW